MKDRISLLIKAKNLTAAQFADEIGVQKSSISHILSGRNNASLDFIQKILLCYPDVSMEWILFGKGPIFKGTEMAPNIGVDQHFTAAQAASLPHVDLFSDLATDRPTVFRTENDFRDKSDEVENTTRDVVENETLLPVKEDAGERAEIKTVQYENKIQGTEKKNNSTKSILKIVEFYSDNTFTEFFPGN